MDSARQTYSDIIASVRHYCVVVYCPSLFLLPTMALGFVGRWEKWRELRSFFAGLLLSFGVIILAVDLAIFANQELSQLGSATLTESPKKIAQLALAGLMKRLAPLLDSLEANKDRVRVIVTLDSNNTLCSGRLDVVGARRNSLWKTLLRAVVHFIKYAFAGKKVQRERRGERGEPVVFCTHLVPFRGVKLACTQLSARTLSNLSRQSLRSADSAP